MDKDIEFDFCIIKNPFASGGRSIVFISKSGDSFLDKEIADNKNYQDIKEILGHFGYTETNTLQFESSNNSDSIDAGTKEVRLFLESCGLTYSRELEVNVIKDIGRLKEKSEKTAHNNLDFIYGDGSLESIEDIPIGEKVKSDLITSKDEIFDFKNKVPGDSEHITLNFYLFLEFGFNEKNAPTIQFGGGFNDTDDLDNKNYIRIVQSEFERVFDAENPHSIILRSTKTQEDFIKEIGMLYKGYFRYQRRIMKGDEIILQNKKFNYKIAEVKGLLRPEQAIIVETNRMGYDRLINISNRIKVESRNESRKWISTGDIEFEAIELKGLLKNKMEDFSQLEDYEEAAKLKREVDFIEDRIEYVQSLDETEITTEEYFNTFSLI